MVSEKFATIEELRGEIISQHKKASNIVITMPSWVVVLFDELAQQERKTTLVVEEQEEKCKVKAVEYDSELHYFSGSGNSNEYFFSL